MKAAGSRFRRRLGGSGKMLTGKLLAHDLRMERDWFGVSKGFNIGREELDNRQGPCWLHVEIMAVLAPGDCSKCYSIVLHI
jgi:hypothetical protein